MVIGVLASFLGGFIFPAYGIVLGMAAKMYDPAISEEQRQEYMKQFVIICSVLSAASWFLGCLQYSCMQTAAEKMSFNLRGMYLDALMKQEIKYFEKQQVEALPSKISEYFYHLSDGAGEKFGQITNAIGMICGGMTIAFIFGWKFAGALISYQPVFFLLVYGVRRAVKSSMIKKFTQGTVLGSTTEETLSALKLVVSFANEKSHIDAYKKIAHTTMQEGKKAAVWVAVYGGLFFGAAIGFSCYSWLIGGVFINRGVINSTTG